MSPAPYGNKHEKIEGYKAFWRRLPVKRPLIGFSIKSWFPLEEFGASRAWQSQDVLTPDMVKPSEFLADQERLHTCFCSMPFWRSRGCSVMR